MLDAACPGNVFVPQLTFVYQTTKLDASPKGVLHLLNNYTGDTMSFDICEMAEAKASGPNSGNQC
jgi:dihydroxyacetone kinase-like protein